MLGWFCSILFLSLPPREVGSQLPITQHHRSGEVVHRFIFLGRRVALVCLMAFAFSSLAPATPNNTAIGKKPKISKVKASKKRPTNVYLAPNTNSNPSHTVYKNTKFQMNCWLDNQGERWFYGQIFDNGAWVYVQAVKVTSQARVGHC